MKDQYLSLSEDLLAMQKKGQFSAAIPLECSFPHEYPFLNHPSTILLLKSSLPVVDHFHPSVVVEFRNEGANSKIDVKIPMVEVIFSVEQIKLLHECLGLIPPAPKHSSRHADLMMSVLDFDLMNRAGIEGVDVVGELNEDDIQHDLKTMLKR